MPIDQNAKLIPRHGGNLDWAARVAGCDRQDILDFSASINPLGCPEPVIELLRSPKLLDLIRHYPDPGYTELRQAIGDYHHIDPDWIMPGNGAAELITWLGRNFAETVDQVQLIVPAFGDYLRALRSAGAKIETFASFANLIANHKKADHGSISEKAGDRAYPNLDTDTNTDADRQHYPAHLADNSINSKKLGLLLNNPHNPSGEIYSRDRILELLPHYQLVAIDEAFMDFLPDPESQSLIAQVKNHPNLVILRSLTKFYALPGLRIGYAIAHPKLIAKWQQWRDPWSVNCVASQAAIACLSDINYQQRTWQWLPEARSQLFKGLHQIPGLVPQPSAANYLLVQSDYSVLALRNRLLKQARILIRDCNSFPELGDRYFRVCVRTRAENESLIAALSELINQF
jgi:L-threonine-O-3-phosphate decarboxylase